ncbi:hypothetical protein DFH08DRAFT_939975 [Mycena albidolilacea]|uniref:Uncharacterized protein n=1 Tax=Mycena albidolilacea TaxID=1033008 RepID=A0AAD6ZPM8_9AGAR|nr:hypothetical protein DFH08DRAFT_939975 [Mycena albidolilacea]
MVFALRLIGIVGDGCAKQSAGGSSGPALPLALGFFHDHDFPSSARRLLQRWNRIHIFRRLERTIFKVAALARPTTMPILMLVAGRVGGKSSASSSLICTIYWQVIASKPAEFLNNSVKHLFLDSVQLSHLEPFFWPRFAALCVNTTLECIVFFVIDKTESANFVTDDGRFVCLHRQEDYRDTACVSHERGQGRPGALVSVHQGSKVKMCHLWDSNK